MTYDDIRLRINRHPVREAEVPTEHHVSLPLPTCRWGIAGYACFAAPAHRAPGRPERIGTPDRWWVVTEQASHLIAYCRTDAAPFGDIPSGPVEPTPPDRTVAQLREDHKVLGELMTLAVPEFLAGRPGDGPLRSDLAEVLAAVLPTEIIPWYRALVPDFFAWLEG